MRQIQKSQEPNDLAEWRSKHSSDPNFGYDLLDSDLRATIKRGLLDEQGRIDAYTEQRIREDSSHIEHLKAQAHCTGTEEVRYTNMVACYPAPNSVTDESYGAIAKGAWPAPAEDYLFVSPLTNGCERRFNYREDGLVEPASTNDLAAQTTIERLNLNTMKLRRYRREAVQGTLGNNFTLSRRDAKVRLRGLRQEIGREITPFYSAIKQGLEAYIQRLKNIHQQNA